MSHRVGSRTAEQLHMGDKIGGVTVLEVHPEVDGGYAFMLVRVPKSHVFDDVERLTAPTS